MKTSEAAEKTKWSIDQAHSEIGFKVRHSMIAHVKGEFRTFDASIYTYGKDLKTAEIDFWIDASSITTGNLKRDKHLKSRDFFDVKRYRQITFRSNTIAQADEEGNHELWGALTILGVTKSIKLNLQLAGMLNNPLGSLRVGFTVTGKICRSDWGFIWNSLTETGDLMVSDEVAILCEVELTTMGQKRNKMQMEPVLCEEEVY